jgi:hypothetical protein
MTSNDQAFILHVKQQCKLHNVKCDLRNTNYVKLENSTMKASGFFDEEIPALVCSMKRHDSIEILAHEFGHFTQWVDQCPAWTNVGNSLNVVDEWLNGKEVPDIKKHLAACRDVELDNEKRTVKLIKKHGLSIDTARYTKKANAYICFYNFMYYSRRWCTPKNSPYTNTVVINAMPSSFRMNYEELSTKYIKLFTEQGF